MMQIARQKGVKGFLIDGSIRDVAAALGLEVGNQVNVAVLRRKES